MKYAAWRFVEGEVLCFKERARVVKYLRTFSKQIGLVDQGAAAALELAANEIDADDHPLLEDDE